MSSNNSSGNTNSSPSTLNMAKSKLGSYMSSGNIITGIFGIVSFSLFITAFVRMSQFLGSKDDWNELKPKVTEIIIYIIVGMVAFTITSIAYFVQNETSSIYFAIVMSCVAISLSFGAMAIAAISR